MRGLGGITILVSVSIRMIYKPSMEPMGTVWAYCYECDDERLYSYWDTREGMYDQCQECENSHISDWCWQWQICELCEIQVKDEE